MHIAFDQQIFNLQTHGGISRYFTNLMVALQENHGIRVQTPFKYIVNRHLDERFPGRYRTLPKPHRVPVWPLAWGLNRSCDSPSRQIEIIHHTYYSSPLALRVSGAKYVCTVHDMIPELFPEQFPLGSPHKHKQRFVEAADVIICVSETTKRDLLRIYGPLDKPVHVTHLATSGQGPATTVTTPVEFPYFLFVGERWGYKNFNLLVRAFALSGASKLGVKVICIGGGKFSRTELRLLNKHGLELYFIQMSPDDKVLNDYYRGAIALCFPSKYEGFGLPIIEAFSLGCPVVVTENPCSIEISDGAALVVDSGSVDGLADAIQRLTADEELRRRLTTAGLVRIKDFDWRTTAKATLTAYQGQDD